ncbi:5-formyltetrahydrofolate cyclo-ligase [Jongsikchunia kroppenstedtii]|uniref:5-formyltetrahydrofolate cyclo-ligase n=1 Tax=Jongsikchunia kroppenstedtii TaxID=1121721 RepID=UPI0003636757|nr:5-formyltetrahydrofolate cyclo-ligase [Jongsikchunia kroppenstedtii]
MQPPHVDPNAIRSKRNWRAQLTAARATLTDDAREAANRSLTVHVAALAVASDPAATIAAYAPAGNEPGSWQLLDTLAAGGAQVLLPVVASGDATALSWAIYRTRDDVAVGRYGICEPTGPRLPPDAIADASLILIPALATDHHGIRLGRGAGYYDRSLPMASGLLVTLHYDHEFVPGPLPMDAHDIPVHATITPELGLQRLPLGNSAA